MFKKKTLFTLLNLAVVSLYCDKLLASPCNIQLNYGVIISPNHIRFVEQYKTSVQINHHQLFIKGREQKITIQQQQLLIKYSDSINQHLPEIVAITLDSITLGIKAINHSIAQMTGESSQSHQGIQKKFEEIKWHVRTRFNHSGEHYYLAPQSFSKFNQLFTDKFEQDISTILLKHELTQASLAETELDITLQQNKINKNKRASVTDDVKASESLSKKITLFCQKLSLLVK